jgi:type I restriction enzyme S subunit
MRKCRWGDSEHRNTHKTIYMPDVESIRVPLPPLEEQRVIVDEAWRRLRRVDRSVDRLNWQIDLLGERRNALITAAVTGELEIPGAAA